VSQLRRDINVIERAFSALDDLLYRCSNDYPPNLIECNKTRRPSVLLADPGGTPGAGRFQFQSESPEGRKVRAYSSAALPRLQLTAAPAG
jgi:hypothetical protein